VGLDEIKCNDGNMKLDIVGQELLGSGASKHTVYRIKGYDSLGEIDVTRRFKEFYLFREIMYQRYPGIFIPPIPPKQASGNTKENFVEERRYFLSQFLRKFSKTYYLAKTPEIQVFLRPSGKVEDSLKNLQKTNTDRVLAYYYKNIRISSPNQKEGVLNKYTNDINDFVKEQKILMGHLKNFKQYIG